MPPVPGLRSPYAKIGRIVFFGRMLDKIRLHADGRLPADYVANLGDSNPRFGDGRCCRFLGVPYAGVREQALASADDLTVLAWAEATGGRRPDEECEVWNAYVMKLGWRDEATARLRERVARAGFESQPIETMFDLMEFDEGRNPVASRAWELRKAVVVVLMGVAGCGKTTVGLKLAAALGWEFRDADEFHPAANIAKLSSGVALNDRDRAPWLAAIRDYIDRCLARGENAVVTCSALRESYRQALVADPARVKLVFLAGDYALILRRLTARQGHFMKPDLLRSQFDTLELPQQALTIDVAQPPEAIVAGIRRALSL